MLTLKLSRIGKKKQPEYRLIVTEKGRDPWGKAQEIIGHINPRSNPTAITLKKDRIEHYLKNGAQCTNTVWNMLVDQGLATGEKRKTSKLSKKRKEKLAKKEQA